MSDANSGPKILETPVSVHENFTGQIISDQDIYICKLPKVVRSSPNEKIYIRMKEERFRVPGVYLNPLDY